MIATESSTNPRTHSGGFNSTSYFLFYLKPSEVKTYLKVMQSLNEYTKKKRCT